MKTGFVRSCLVALLFAGAGLAVVAPMAARAGENDSFLPGEGIVVECSGLVFVTLSKESFPHCQQGARRGDPVAQYWLGQSYVNPGFGVQGNAYRAERWYLLSAKQGYAEAQYSLGEMFGSVRTQPYSIIDADNPMEDPIKSAYWYRKAAEQGHASAQWSISAAYRLGEGVQQNDREALIWMSVHYWNVGYWDWDSKHKVFHEVVDKLSESEYRSAHAEARKRHAAIEAGTYGKESAE